LHGWPWNVASPPSRGEGLPRFTVVTPSFNQGAYLEETIRSVLLQGYPNLEYFIVDGGSTDGSVEIIRRYEPWITWWCSEPDRGQADAINKALRRATGEIFNWINSDDRLEPGTLFAVARNLRGHVDAVAGGCRFLFETQKRVELVQNEGLDALSMINGRQEVTLCQPALWLFTDRVRKLGGFNSESHFYFDAELFIRYLSCWPRVCYVADPLATFRIHGESKTGSEPDGFRREYVRALRRLAIDAPDDRVRRRAADRLRELKLHCRYRNAFGAGSRRKRFLTGLSLMMADFRPSSIRVGIRWLLAYMDLLRAPIGDVAELREIASWPEMVL